MSSDIINGVIIMVYILIYIKLSYPHREKVCLPVLACLFWCSIFPISLSFRQRNHIICPISLPNGISSDNINGVIITMVYILIYIKVSCPHHKKVCHPVLACLFWCYCSTFPITLPHGISSDSINDVIIQLVYTDQYQTGLSLLRENMFLGHYANFGVTLFYCRTPPICLFLSEKSYHLSINSCT